MKVCCCRLNTQPQLLLSVYCEPEKGATFSFVREVWTCFTVAFADTGKLWKKLELNLLPHLKPFVVLPLIAYLG